PHHRESPSLAPSATESLFASFHEPFFNSIGQTRPSCDVSDRSTLPPKAAVMLRLRNACPARSARNGHPHQPIFDQRQRYGKAERFGSLEIDDQCKLGRRLHRKIGRLFAL